MDTEGERRAEDIHSNGNEVHNNNLDLNDVELSEFDVPVFIERTTIRVQPRRNDNADSRQAMPISTIDWRTSNINHTIPLSGLEYLEGIDQVYIEQTVELTDLLAYIESENRYLVKIPQGETLFVAAETSSVLQRQFCGSHRGFQLDIFDQRRQQAFYLNRNLRCNVCLLGCYLQDMHVFSPSTGLIGTIQQEWKLLLPLFLIRDPNGRVLYRIIGPEGCGFSRYSNATFKVSSSDGSIQQGSIMHHWDEDINGYSITVVFPSRETTVPIKTLILGAAFLLEYIYFEKSKRASCFRCFS